MRCDVFKLTKQKDSYEETIEETIEDARIRQTPTRVREKRRQKAKRVRQYPCGSGTIDYVEINI